MAIVVAFLAAAPAMAANSTVDLGGNFEVFYKAAAGQVNQLEISGDATSLTVRDTGTDSIVPSGDCAPTADPQTVTCTGATSIRVNVSNLDDTVTLTTQLVSELAGRDGDDNLNGSSGQDTLLGGEGNDFLNGGEGGDTLAGDAGDDRLLGGSGVDRANYASASGATVDLRNSSAQDTGAGMDTLIGIEDVNGSSGPDHLTGDGGPNTFIGSGGADTFHVEEGGSDVVNCGAGADTVFLDRTDTLRGACETVDDNMIPETTITAGPTGATNDPRWSFTSDEPWARFECADVTGSGSPGSSDWASCNSPETLPATPEGSTRTFYVRAVDDQSNNDASPESRTFTINTTAPDTEVQGPAGRTSDSTPEFFFSSSDPSATFLCRFDSQSFAICPTPFTADPLGDGEHTLEVVASDPAGNIDQTPATVTFVVDTSGTDPAPGDGPAPNPQQPQQGGGGPQVQQAKIIIGSLVLISGNAVKMSRTGRVSISLTCAGAIKCSGRLSLTTAEPVSKRDRRLVTLGAKKFSIGANKKRRVNVKFSKRSIRLAKRLKRFKAKAVIREIDSRGNPRISSRLFTLRAR